MNRLLQSGLLAVATALILMALVAHPPSGGPPPGEIGLAESVHRAATPQPRATNRPGAISAGPASAAFPRLQPVDWSRVGPADTAAGQAQVVRTLMLGRPLAHALEGLDDPAGLDGATRGSLLWALDLCAQVDSPAPVGLSRDHVVPQSPFCRALDPESIHRWRQRLSVPPEQIWTDLGLDDILELRKRGLGEHTAEIRELALEHLRTADDFYSFVELGSVINAPVLEALWQRVPDHDLVLEYHLALHAAWLKVLCRDNGGCGPDGLVTLELCMSLITRCRPGDGFADVVLNNLGPATQGVFWDWVGLVEDHRNHGERLVNYLAQ